MKNKWLKALFVVTTVVPWSVVIVLLLQIKSIVSRQPKVEAVPVIEIADTIINEQPKFFSQTPKEGLEEALSYYGLEHKDIVYAQAILESNLGKSPVYKRTNNLFGLYDSVKREYFTYNHWSDGVLHYKIVIQSKLKEGEDYYSFLERIKYAKDPDYINKLKRIKIHDRNLE